MPVIGLSIVIQLLCAVHCARNSRNNIWLMVIIFLSLPGCLAYAAFEIFPAYAGSRHVRSAKAAAVRKLDPERELRAARDALDLADTAANQIALGDALVEAGSHKHAIGHYRAAMAKSPAADRATQLKLARAELEAGDAAAARQHLETLPSPDRRARTTAPGCCWRAPCRNAARTNRRSPCSPTSARDCREPKRTAAAPPC
ncbi:MAG TPA: tetratricopeptide repeat protein [Allosphingosinicella sp.]|nr:tetratricopeptide repeat protein [Allosphingosinicella sp.]